MCIYVYIHIYIYIDMFTYVYIYTHSDTYVCTHSPECLISAGCLFMFNMGMEDSGSLERLLLLWLQRADLDRAL